MSDMGFVWSGWAVVGGGLAAYAAVVFVRARALAERVPEERRFWMTTDDGLDP